MKQILSYCLLLPVFVFTTAQAAPDTKNGVSDKNTTAETHTAATTNDDKEVTNKFDVALKPGEVMLAVNTDCAGRLYFYNKKGKEKGECIVNEGTSMIDIQYLLYPGTYTCRFEAANGSITETTIVFKKFDGVETE